MFLTRKVAAEEDKRVGKNGACRKWPQHARAVREAIGLAQGSQPWTRRKALAGCPPSQRVRELIDICFWKLRTQRPGVPEKVLVQDVWLHITQSIERIPMAIGNAPCLLSNSSLYSMSADCCLSGHGHMKVIGWPDQMLQMEDEITDGEWRDMAGNAFSTALACLMSTACIMNAHGPWWRGEA